MSTERITELERELSAATTKAFSYARNFRLVLALTISLVCVAPSVRAGTITSSTIFDRDTLTPYGATPWLFTGLDSPLILINCDRFGLWTRLVDYSVMLVQLGQLLGY